MIELPILRDLGVVIIAATVLLVAARTVRLPPIVAYILAGLLLGPVTGLVRVTESVELLSEVGIALLLFLVGLELSFEKIRDVGKVAVYAGLGQVVFTAIGGFLLSLLLGFDWLTGLFIATALTFSSTVVVVKLLDQKGEIDALYGRIAVGIFLVQDLVVIVVLTFLAGLGSGEAPTLGGAASGLGLAFGGMGLLLAAATASARWVLPRPMGWLAGSPEALFVWSLCWCFLFVLGAEAMDLSLEIGAFLAGISLAQLPYNAELRRRVHPLMNLFVAVFFVSLGVQMQLGAATEHAWASVVFTLFVLLGNPLIFIFIIARMRFSERTAFLAGVTVAQISEFSFVFAAMGLSAGLIDESALSLIGLVGLLTIGVSSYMILYNHQLYDLAHRWGVLRIFGGGGHDEPEPPEELKDHVVVAGMNTLGRRIVEGLVRNGERVLAVDTDRGKLEGLPVPTLLGSIEHGSVLEAAGVERAKLVVSALQIEDINNLLAYRCRRLGVPVSVHAFDPILVRDLEEIGADHIMVSKREGIQQLARALRELGVLD